MKSFKTLSITLILAVAVCIGGFGTAIAVDYDDVYENEADENTELTVNGIQKQDVEPFLEAAEKISEIRAEYSENILEAVEGDKGDERYEELRSEANDKMVEAIEDAGLHEEVYRGIAYHLQEDEDLFSKIE